MKPSAPTRHNYWTDVLLVAVFVLVMVLPLGSKQLLTERPITTGENRRLASFPKLAWESKSLKAFPAAFEKYFDDRFGFRDELIRLHHLTKMQLPGVSPSPKVILGKEGWMFDLDTVQYYEAPPLTTEDLEKWREFLEERQKFVTAKGHPFLLVFAPLSSTIYPEYLPDSRQHSQRASRLDQLMAHLRAHSSIPTLDLRQPLLEAKKTERLYQRTDTHWNELGAYQGYRHIVQSLAGDIPGLKPVPRSEYEIRPRYTEGGDISRLMGLSDLFGEERFEFTRRGGPHAHIAEFYPEGASIPMGFSMKTGDTTKPRAIVYHDSFTWASLYPFLAENFSEVWFHWNLYYGPDLEVMLYSYATNDNFVWKPDEQVGLSGTDHPLVVIVEIAERNLLYSPPPTWRQLDQYRRAKNH